MSGSEVFLNKCSMCEAYRGMGTMQALAGDANATLYVMSVSVKRVYEAPEPADGLRVLVDRLWPRGIPKEEAKIDLWLKDVAPSTSLRKWFGHDRERWPEFQRRYRAELTDNQALAELRMLCISPP